MITSWLPLPRGIVIRCVCWFVGSLATLAVMICQKYNSDFHEIWYRYSASVTYFTVNFWEVKNKIDARFQWTTNKKWHGEWNGHVTDDVTRPWNVKVATPICLWSNISKNYKLCYNGAPIENCIRRIEWSRARWHHVTRCVARACRGFCGLWLLFLVSIIVVVVVVVVITLLGYDCVLRVQKGRRSGYRKRKYIRRRR